MQYGQTFWHMKVDVVPDGAVVLIARGKGLARFGMEIVAEPSERIA